MGQMTGSAVAILDRLMLDLGGGQLLFKIVVAFEAELAVRFDEELFVVRRVGIVARQAFGVDGRLVGGFGLVRKFVMAFKANFVRFFDKQFFVLRFVCFVTTQAIAILHRLMLDLVDGNEVLVAGEAKLPCRPLEALHALKNGSAAVALTALALGKRFVDEVRRNRGEKWFRRNLRGFSTAFVGRSLRNGASRCVFRWHAVEKNREQLPLAAVLQPVVTNTAPPSMAETGRINRLNFAQNFFVSCLTGTSHFFQPGPPQDFFWPKP